MVSKQIIVKATLSVALVLSWGACASAMYDPYVGRFASRDPIGMMGGLNSYSLRHTLQGCDPLGLKEWIVGPEAATVSYIANFTPTADLFWDFFNESQRGGVNPLQPGDYHLVMALLNELANSANPDPASSYRTWGTLLRSKEFRGFGRLQVAIACNCGFAITDVFADSDSNHGYTPIRTPGGKTVDYEPGDGGAFVDISYADDISSALWTGTSNNAFCARAVLKHEFRIGWVGRFVSQLVLGVGVPFAWADIDYRMCCDTQYRIQWWGSNFPTHWAYLNKTKVGSRNQRGLGEFIFRTPNARAAGGPFHTASGSGTRVST